MKNKIQFIEIIDSILNSPESDLSKANSKKLVALREAISKEPGKVLSEKHFSELVKFLLLLKEIYDHFK